MKNIIKSPEEFEYGEYYYIRRKSNIQESIGEYSWIWTRLDCDTLGVIDASGEDSGKYELREYDLSAGIFRGLEILDFERFQSEYHKLWIELRYRFLGVYLDKRNIETRKDVLYLRDPEIQIGSKFFGLKNFTVGFKRVEDFKLGTINQLKDPDNLFLDFETDVLCRYTFINSGGRSFREYRGALDFYDLAISWDDDLYQNIYIPRKLETIKSDFQTILS